MSDSRSTTPASCPSPVKQIRAIQTESTSSSSSSLSFSGSFKPPVNIFAQLDEEDEDEEESETEEAAIPTSWEDEVVEEEVKQLDRRTIEEIKVLIKKENLPEYIKQEGELLHIITYDQTSFRYEIMKVENDEYNLIYESDL
jgi:hypothetical protein